MSAFRPIYNSRVGEGLHYSLDNASRDVNKEESLRISELEHGACQVLGQMKLVDCAVTSDTGQLDERASQTQHYEQHYCDDGNTGPCAVLEQTKLRECAVTSDNGQLDARALQTQNYCDNSDTVSVDASVEQTQPYYTRSDTGPVDLRSEQTQPNYTDIINYQQPYNHWAAREAVAPQKRGTWNFSLVLGVRIRSFYLSDKNKTYFLHVPSVLRTLGVSKRFFRAKTRSILSKNLVRCVDFMFTTSVLPVGVHPTDKFICSVDVIALFKLYRLNSYPS